jgi:hypothetical protein
MEFDFPVVGKQSAIATGGERFASENGRSAGEFAGKSKFHMIAPPSRTIFPEEHQELSNPIHHDILI